MDPEPSRSQTIVLLKIEDKFVPISETGVMNCGEEERDKGRESKEKEKEGE